MSTREQWERERVPGTTSKHAGERWADVPESYLLWAAKNAHRAPELKDGAQGELHRRGISFDPRVRVTLHAVNSMSIRLWPIYTTLRRSQDEGIVDFLERIGAETLEPMRGGLEAGRRELPWRPDMRSIGRAVEQNPRPRAVLHFEIKAQEGGGELQCIVRSVHKWQDPLRTPVVGRGARP